MRDAVRLWDILITQQFFPVFQTCHINKEVKQKFPNTEWLNQPDRKPTEHLVFSIGGYSINNKISEPKRQLPLHRSSYTAWATLFENMHINMGHFNSQTHIIKVILEPHTILHVKWKQTLTSFTNINEKT